MDKEAAIKGGMCCMMELFAGIGGMQLAANEANLDVALLYAYEINPSALETYWYNKKPSLREDLCRKNIVSSRIVPSSSESGACNRLYNKGCGKTNGRYKARNIMGLTSDEWDQIRPDWLTLSPPCQPFTRLGLARDVTDSRCEPLLHVLELLQRVSHLPSRVLLENVKGFETSQARDQVLSVLRRRDYCIQEFLLCPTQIGIPNSRLRYYLLAYLPISQNCSLVNAEISNEFPFCLCLPWIQAVDVARKCKSCQKVIVQSSSSILEKTHRSTMKNFCEQAIKSYMDVTPSISQFLSGMPSQEACLRHCPNPSNFRGLHSTGEQVKVAKSTPASACCVYCRHEVERNILVKYCKLFDIVDSDSKRSCCFTKGYGRLVERTGSVFNPSGKKKLDEVFKQLQNLGSADETQDKRLELLQSLGLRYFTSEEALRLMGFPVWFQFPPNQSAKTRRELIGNSINVQVVAVLMAYLEHSWSHSDDCL